MHPRLLPSPPPVRADAVTVINDPRVHKVLDLTPKMISKNDVFNAKAAETHGLMGFAVLVLDRYMEKFAGLGESKRQTAKYLLSSVRAAERFNDRLLKNGRDLPDHECQSLLSDYTHFMTMYTRAGGRPRPKFHLMFHCIQRIKVFGNPRFYWAYKAVPEPMFVRVPLEGRSRALEPAAAAASTRRGRPS